MDIDDHYYYNLIIIAKPTMNNILNDGHYMGMNDAYQILGCYLDQLDRRMKQSQMVYLFYINSLIN